MKKQEVESQKSDLTAHVHLRHLYKSQSVSETGSKAVAEVNSPHWDPRITVTLPISADCPQVMSVQLGTWKQTQFEGILALINLVWIDRLILAKLSTQAGILRICYDHHKLGSTLRVPKRKKQAVIGSTA